jgi:hypothetical protein
MAGTIRRTGLFLALLLSATVALAQSGGPAPALTPEEVTSNRESVRCISAGAIRETESLDNRNIVFRLRNGDYYLNTLISRCENLERSNRISFTTPSGRLCSGHLIGVIQPFSNANRPIGSCGLRRFFPVSEEEAALLGVEEAERRGIPQMEVDNPNAEDPEPEDVELEE